MGLISLLEKRRKKKETAELSFLMDSYKKKEVTKWGLCKNIGGIIGYGGLVTPFTAGVCGASSAGFIGGIYFIGERFFGENPARLTDYAGWMMLLLGGTALVSGWGTKELYHLTRRKYDLFRDDYKEHTEKKTDKKV